MLDLLRAVDNADQTKAGRKRASEQLISYNKTRTTGWREYFAQQRQNGVAGRDIAAAW